MSTLITLPYPQRRDDILRFVRKHHYTRRCPGVWTIAYAYLNPAGKVQAVTIYGPPPYPNISRAFVRDSAHSARLIWQSRMVGAGISAQQLDSLLAYAAADLMQRGYWWQYTTTDPVSKCIDNTPLRLCQPAYTGEVYHRNGWHYLGYAGGNRIEGFLVDGNLLHNRQGAITLTLSNIRQHYPNSTIRVIRGNPKQRWAYILADNPAQRAQHLLLMRYHIQPYAPITQPRLLWKGGRRDPQTALG